MKRLNIIVLFLGLCTLNVAAQTLTASEKEIFQAMDDEMMRSKEIELDENGKPFFISYASSFCNRFYITSSLGVLTNNVKDVENSLGSVQLMLGDYRRTSQSFYEGRFIGARMPLEPDYNGFRYNFWFLSDLAYKTALRTRYVLESNKRITPPSSAEQELDDFMKLEKPSVSIIGNIDYQMDYNQWESNLRELSALFANYKDLYNSSVILEGVQGVIYKKTSEGVIIREPIGYIKLIAKATVKAKDGLVIEDSYGVSKMLPKEMPSIDILKKQMAGFAEKLVQLGQVDMLAETYTGPVLFEGGACSGLFTGNLLKNHYLYATRSRKGLSTTCLNMEFGRLVLDKRITVKNYTSLKEYNGAPLIGNYELDAEGVVPQKEVLLIDKGVMTNQLNGRYPTVKAPKSTGSSRFAVNDSEISYVTAPGTIHIQVEGGIKEEKMKSALLSEAKKKKLSHAYIVRKMSGRTSHIFRVDVKTGEETMVRIGDLSQYDIDVLKKVVAISSKEVVGNYMTEDKVHTSIICPSSIILSGIELKTTKPAREKESDLIFPLQRNN